MTSLGETKSDKQVKEAITPEVDEMICDVLGGPILYSKNDTQETRDQVSVLHNSQWKEFDCGR